MKYIALITAMLVLLVMTTSANGQHPRTFKIKGVYSAEAQ